MADVSVFRLTDEEKQRLLDPVVDGVILLRHSFEDVMQLRELVYETKAVRTPEPIVAVDHEDGRVQHFIDGFTRLPAMDMSGRIWDGQGPATAKVQVEQAGWVLVAELSVCGIDPSFIPVLDLDWRQCAIIGNHNFHHDAEIAAELAPALQKRLSRGGMKSCGKYSPGHGFAEGDNHHVLSQDGRSTTELEAADIVSFRRMSAAGMAAVMPIHVVYLQVDGNPAGFSAKRSKDILRHDIGFKGVIFSNGLMIEGVCGADGIKERARALFDTGRDTVLVCNRPDLINESRDGFDMPDSAEFATRWQYMTSTLGAGEAERTMQVEVFRAAQEVITRLASPKDTEGGMKVGEVFRRSPSDFVIIEPPSKPQTV